MSEPKVVRNKVTVITETRILKQSLLRNSFVHFRNKHKADAELVAVEIGVWEGVNAKYMLLLDAGLKLCLVDDWSNVTVFTGGPVQDKHYSDTIKNIAQLNLKDFGDRVNFTMKNSVEAVKDFEDESIDYVYVDGDHEYEPVKLDMQLWWPKVKKGGVMGGHDVLMKEVSTALHEFLMEEKIPMDRWGKDVGGEGRSDFWIFK